MPQKVGMLILSCMLAIAVVPLAGCDRFRNYSESELIQRAKDFQNKGKHKAAIIELKNSLQKNPNNAEARLMLGQVYIDIGQGSGAEKEFLKAIKLGVKEESIKVSLGEALLLQQEYQRVLKEIVESTQTSTRNSARIQRLHGDAWLGLGRWEQGCSLYRQSIVTDPSNVPALWGLARCAAATKDINQVRTLIQQAINLDPKNSKSWILLGDFESGEHNLRVAQEAYSKAIQTDPENITPHLSAAAFYLSNKRFNEANAELTTARKLAPGNVMVKYTQSLADFHQGKLPQARDTLQDVLRQLPDYFPAILLYGSISYGLGNYEQAEQYAGRFLAQYPGSDYARKLLAATLLKKGDITRAQETLNPLLARQSPDPYVLALAADAALGARDYERAGEFLEKAVSIAPQDASLKTQLGVAYLAKGQTDKAIAELEAVAINDTKTQQADLILIRTYLDKQEWDNALGAVNQLEKKFPNNPLVFNLRGAAFVGKNDVTNARKNYEKALTISPTYYGAAYNLARLDKKDNNLAAARKRFKGILAKDNNNLRALLAMVEFSNDNDEAESWLERAVKTNPNVIKPRKLLVANYLSKKNVEKALALAHEGVERNPDHPEAIELLGVAQAETGKTADALVTYNKLVNLVPQSPLAYYRLAAMQMLAKQPEGAKKSLRKALGIKPDYTEAQLALVSLETSTGNFAEAHKVSQHVQKLFDTSPAGWVMEGDVYMAQKKYAEAIKAFEKAFNISKDGLMIVKIHQAKTKAGEEKMAEAEVLNWLATNPDDYVVRGYMARIYAQQGKIDKSIGQYEYILQKNKNNAELLNELAWLYSQLRDQKALALAEEANKLKPNDPRILDTLGWVLVDQERDIPRGLELLKQAVEGSPQSSEIGYHYAVALSKTGNPSKARKQIEEALATNKDFPEKAKAKALLKQLR